MDQVKRLQEKGFTTSNYMELIKFFKDYNYSVKVPELAVGSWCNLVEETEKKKEVQRNKK